MKSSSDFPQVSIIFSALNEEDIIGAKINNFYQLDYPENRKELIFGSDGSDDATVSKARECARGHVRFVEFTARRGKISVLNDIVGLAKGDILVFTDANTMFAPDALQKLIAPFADPQVGCVSGNLILGAPTKDIGPQGESIYWRYENWIKALESRFGCLVGATGGIYAVRRDLFEPFPSEKLIMDDFWQPINVFGKGCRVVYEPEARAYESASSTLADEFRRKTRIGHANYNVIRLIAKYLHPRFGLFAFNLWSHKIIRWAVPFLLPLAFFTNLNLALQAGGQGFYSFLFAAQLCFYFLVLVGYFMQRSGRSLPLVQLPLYLAATNAALLVGFFRFLSGTTEKSWVRVHR